MATTQWPRNDTKLLELVEYLGDAEEFDPTLHAMGLCELFAGGLRMTYAGFWSVQGRHGLTVHDCFVPQSHDRKRPFLVYSQALTKLSVCLLLKRYPAAFVGSYLYNMLSKAVGRPEHLFWVDAWKRVSWAMTPSLRFVAAATIQRADLCSFVDGCRGRLARALLSNDKIDTLIDGLIGDEAPWRITAGTALADAVFSAIKHADVVLAPVPAGSARCDLRIEDGAAPRKTSRPLCLVMARRDRILLALYLLLGRAGEPGGQPVAALAKEGLPCFRRCFEQHPALDPANCSSA